MVTAVKRAAALAEKRCRSRFVTAEHCCAPSSTVEVRRRPLSIANVHRRCRRWRPGAPKVAGLSKVAGW